MLYIKTVNYHMLHKPSQFIFIICIVIICFFVWNWVNSTPPPSPYEPFYSISSIPTLTNNPPPEQIQPTTYYLFPQQTRIITPSERMYQRQFQDISRQNLVDKSHIYDQNIERSIQLGVANGTLFNEGPATEDFTSDITTNTTSAISAISATSATTNISGAGKCLYAVPYKSDWIDLSDSFNQDTSNHMYLTISMRSSGYIAPIVKIYYSNINTVDDSTAFIQPTVKSLATNGTYTSFTTIRPTDSTTPLRYMRIKVENAFTDVRSIVYVDYVAALTLTTTSTSQPISSISTTNQTTPISSPVTVNINMMNSPNTPGIDYGITAVSTANGNYEAISTTPDSNRLTTSNATAAAENKVPTVIGTPRWDPAYVGYQTVLGNMLQLGYLPYNIPGTQQSSGVDGGNTSSLSSATYNDGTAPTVSPLLASPALASY